MEQSKICIEKYETLPEPTIEAMIAFVEVKGYLFRSVGKIMEPSAHAGNWQVILVVPQHLWDDVYINGFCSGIALTWQEAFLAALNQDLPKMPAYKKSVSSEEALASFMED